MKIIRLFPLFVLAFLATSHAQDQEGGRARESADVTEQANDERIVLVPWAKSAKPAPLFFSARAEVKGRVSLDEVTSAQTISFQVHQGKAETLTLGLSGPGEITDVTGDGLRDWSVRVAAGGERFLDIRPAEIEGKLPENLTVDVRTRLAVKDGAAGVLLPSPGQATGFALSVTLDADPGVDLKVTKAEGLSPLEDGKTRGFVGTAGARIDLTVSPADSSAAGLELADSRLEGKLADDGKSVSFRFRATAGASREGASIVLLGGGAALSGEVSGDGWHVALAEGRDQPVYQLVAGRPGVFPIDLSFVVPIGRDGDWRKLAFVLPAGVVVPVELAGLSDDVSFGAGMAVVPRRDGGLWRGFLPASGNAAMAWRPAGELADGALFFTSSEATDVLVGSGLLRQRTTMSLRVLQGKLDAITLDLTGPGEVLSVTGDAVTGWAIREEEGGRLLDVTLSRPIEGKGTLDLRTQAALGGFPVKADVLRATPRGSLRHNGWLRVSNDGAVRVEVAETNGLIQLAPDQFPGGAADGARQSFVYRFPSAEYAYQVRANQVLPETGVTEVTVYELGETDRRILSDIELDIREAPVREWELEIPADHAVASVTGAEVADYAVSGEAAAGMRKLKVIFREPVAGRRLVHLTLEKNEAAKAGPWKLTPLGFPEAKSRRGSIGAVATAGYRLGVAASKGLAEVPLTFFPKKAAGLQQAFRLREGDWSVSLDVEALGQSVQADVFHLYSLKTGAVYGSVLINYFVVGAPATEWRVSVPEGIGNVDVTGQNVGRDWRREENTVIVPLTRPLSGAGTLLLTFERPMSAGGGTLTPGDVRPLGVQGERGFVQVVSPLQVNHKETSEGSLLRIDPSELPAEFRLLSSAPTIGVWQYTSPDFKISMDIEWFRDGETVDQVVDFAKLSSRVSRDGQWVTDARFFVKSRGRSALRVKFPDPGMLWEAKVDGSAVNARIDGGDTLIPLPAHGDPNRTVEIALRYGPEKADSGKVELTSPALEAPMVLGEWTIEGDEGRRLVPRGGNIGLVRPVLAEDGWSWLRRHRAGGFALLLTGLAALGAAAGNPRGARLFVSLFAGLLFLVLCGLLALDAHATRGAASDTLEYAAPVVPAGGALAVQLANQPEWLARVDWGVWLVLIVGIAIAGRGWWKKDRFWFACGAASVLAAFLGIRDGGVLFFSMLLLGGLSWWLPRVWAGVRSLKKRGKAAATAALGGLLLIGSAGNSEAADFRNAERISYECRISDGRLRGTLELTLRAEAGDRFLLLAEPAVLSGFEGEGLHVVKAPLGKRKGWVIEAGAEGRLTGRANFEMPMPDPTKGWELPGGLAAARSLRVEWDQGGYEFLCDAAARVSAVEGLAAGRSGAEMLLPPVDPVVITARPKQRDVASEETKFFSEVSNLFLTSPGVVNGLHRITIRPSQGRVEMLTMRVPAGFTVSDVSDGPVGSWRYDPGSGELRVPVEPAQDKEFRILVETQRGTDALPTSVEVAPVRADGSAGEVGLLGLIFSDEAQADSIREEGMSRVNPEDFDAALLPKNNQGAPLFPFQHAFRYSNGEPKAVLRVSPVSPELRSEFRQLVSLGDDRLVVSSDLDVLITRSGVFRLDLTVPDGLEIESATGDALSHWTEHAGDDGRVLTLHLSGKTLGVQTFSITMSGKPTGAVADWQTPRVSLRGASRETGVLTVVPERGLQVRAVNRRNVSQLDPRELGEAPEQLQRDASRPGALVYRILQGDWRLGLAITRLDPWVTARVLHEVTMREGQVLHQAKLVYKIENAAVKSLRVKLPSLDEAAAATLRGTGPAVADFVPVDGEEGVYEIRFQRGIAGNTEVELAWQRATSGGDREDVAPVQLEDVRQITYFTAIRPGGRLELEAGDLPRGWQRSDWSIVRTNFGSRPDATAPNLVFRVADPEGPLSIRLKRHELADLRKIRVSGGDLLTLLSPDGAALTAVTLRMEVSGKNTLRLKLPEGSGMFNVFVNSEGAPLVREGEDWLFHVFPSPEAGRPAEVRFVYSSRLGDGRRLEGPLPDVPMENLSWRVLVPEGWRVADHDGDFDLQQRTEMGAFKLEDYQSFVESKRASDAKSAVALLDQANEWLRAGDQEKASQFFGNALNQGNLDAASGEDARVQLRALKTQQAVLGLNTRRQKVVLDNRSNAPQQEQNAQLDRAVELNPVIRGAYNFDPRQFDRFLEGNTADENAALKEIANRIVSQQLAAEPAPAAIDITLPERGTMLDFRRSVQVGGDRPMFIELEIERPGRGFGWLAFALCLLTGAMIVLRRKSRAAA
ncbi:MAG: hypothetical protein H7A49_15990 [Akkermansiaceae bacterium]|nr:hypothetical protein [Akkermansiaceae bacterium]